jgi:hypothetical protein
MELNNDLLHNGNLLQRQKTRTMSTYFKTVLLGYHLPFYTNEK